MKEKTSDKRIIKGEETYNRIITSAMDIISEGGISALTASKLSVFSNISKSNLFHHFSSINEIPEVVLEQIFKELLQPLDNSAITDINQLLNNFGEYILDLSEECKRIYKAFYSFYNESLFNKKYCALLKSYLTSTTESLSRQLKKYSMKPLSDEEYLDVARLILSSLDGICLHILLVGKETDYIRSWKIQVSMICNLLK